MQNVLGLRPEIFLSAAQCREALKNPKFPSAYQLLPRPGVPALLAQSAQTGFSIVDAFDPAVAAQFGLVSGSLRAAQELATELPFIGPNFRSPCPYVAVVGNEQSTIVANYRVSGRAPQRRRRMHPATARCRCGAPHLQASRCAMSPPPTWKCAAIPIRSRCCGPCCGLTFRAAAFSRSGRESSSFSVQPLKTSVRPGETFTVAVVADRPAPSIDAQVIMQRVFDNDQADAQTVPIYYQGGPLRSLPLEFTAPEQRATLLFTLQDSAGAQQGKQASVLVVT